MISIGQYFKYNGLLKLGKKPEVYKLVAIDCHLVALVSLHGCNTWDGTTYVENPENITIEEWRKIAKSSVDGRVAFERYYEPVVVNEKAKVSYHTGQRFRDKEERNSTYVLAQVEQNRVALIGIENGNRFGDPVQVNNIHAITEDEFWEIAVQQVEIFTLIS